MYLMNIIQQRPSVRHTPFDLLYSIHHRDSGLYKNINDETLTISKKRFLGETSNYIAIKI